MRMSYLKHSQLLIALAVLAVFSAGIWIGLDDFDAGPTQTVSESAVEIPTTNQGSSAAAESTVPAETPPVNDTPALPSTSPRKVVVAPQTFAEIVTWQKILAELGIDDSWRLPSLTNDNLGQVQRLRETIIGLAQEWATEAPEAFLAELEARKLVDGPFVTGFILAQIAADNRLPTTAWTKHFNVAAVVLEHDVATTKPFIVLQLLTAQQVTEDNQRLHTSAINSALTAARLHDESAAATWLLENFDNLPEGFDAVHTLQKLHSYTYPTTTLDAEQQRIVDELKATGDYSQALLHLRDVAVAADQPVDDGAVALTLQEWLRRDSSPSYYSEVVAALQEIDADPSHVRQIFQAWGIAEDSFKSALAVASQFSQSERQADAYSNLAVGRSTAQGSNADTNWIRDLSPGFPRDRSIAGHLLGLSRNLNDDRLEAAVKVQMMTNDFDFAELRQAVEASEIVAPDLKLALNQLMEYGQ